MSGADWIDVTVPIRHGMVHWPGDPPITITRVYDLAQGDPATVSHLAMGAHTGTHVDAPLHFLRMGKTVAEMPPDVMIGPARVIGVSGDVVSAAAIRAADVHPGDRLLFRTQNASLWQRPDFSEEFVYLTTEAARELATRQAALVGIDYLSVAGYGVNETEVHRVLLEAGIWILEGLDLSHAAPGRYELVCLPLRLDNAEGAPARVLLRAMEPVSAPPR